MLYLCKLVLREAAADAEVTVIYLTVLESVTNSRWAKAVYPGSEPAYLL
jgi:hypothetical protein